MASTGPQRRRGDDEAANHQRHRHRFVSDDLNVRVQGKILEQKEPGRIDGIRLELDLPEHQGDAAGGDEANEREDAITVLYPQLVSIHTKPESQTLVSINTGERLLTLETPLISDQDSDLDREDDDGDDNAIDDDDDDDVSDIEGGDERTEKRKQPLPEAKGKEKKRRPVVITLHEGFLPASEATQLEESSLYSATFRIVIDGPSYPLPHFDPAVLAPPTPAVRPHGGAGGGMSDSNSAYGGVLNSPTLQRALLSPLLSPQRRAASQGSDMSVPPLSLGLSRASRPSFSAAERPHIDNSIAGQKRPAPVTLVTLIPSLAPPKPSAFPTSSTTPQVGPSSAHQQHQHNGNNHNRQTLPPAPTLAGTLTSALSTAAKRTAEEILALRRTHDAYQRRAKAELEILEARIENARSEAGVAVAVGGTESVVRGFKTKEERAKEREDRNASVSRSRERGRGEARGRSYDRDTSGSAERPPYASPAVRPSLGSASTSSSSVPNRDEAASALIRAQDEREEDERGRSRSRSRRTGPPAAAAAAPGGAHPSGSSASRGRPEASSSASSSSTNNAQVSGSATQRSRSRTKAVAEATLRAVEAAKERQGGIASPTGASDGSPSPGMGHGQGQATLAPPPPAPGAGSGQGGERRARSPLSRENETTATSPDAAPTSPKSKPKQQASTASVKESGTNASSSSPASSGSQPLPPASRSHPPGPAAAGSTTPAFAPSSHALVAIPETDELSIPLERTHSGGLNLDVPNDPPPAVRVEQEPEEESEPPFEMDEDVEMEERGSAAPVRSRQQAPALDSPSLEPETTSDAPLLASSPPRPSEQQQQIPVSSSFRPGSYQRASALSASYNALLSSAKSAPSRPAVNAVSPVVHSPRSPFSALEEPTLTEDQLPPFSPPDVRSYMSTSVREEAQTALLAATLEHAERSRRVDGDGSSRGSSSVGGGGKGSAYIGPDPRDVRKGEQKIRDVLAMDVPSHRPRGGTKQTEQQSTPGRGFDDDDDDEDGDDPSSEEFDTVEELVCPSNVGSRGVGMSEASADPAGGAETSSMPVGSLPIALGRPSSVNAALSSWRPDPERLWAQQRRERKTSASVAPPPLHSPAGRLIPEAAPGGGSTSKSPQVTAGGQAILVSSSPSPQSGTRASPTHPVEIGSPTIPRPADVGGGQGGSSLARSLRAQQGVGTFVQLTSSGTTAAHRRSGGEGTGSAPGPNGRDPFDNERRSADRGGDSDDNHSAEGKEVKDPDKEQEEEEDDDEDEFVPPHLVKGRRDREDEEWLSRSVPQS